MQEKTISKNDTSELTRRDFIKMGASALSLLAVLEVGGASLLFMQPRSLEGEFGGSVNAGPADSFPIDSVTHFPDGRFYLIRADNGGFLAVYQRCTHLGCTVSWEPDSNRFFCPCHASAFDFHGNVQNPPAPRALDTFAVIIEAGDVIVNTGAIQTRDAYAPEQLAF